jgi:hypothetical protein
MSLAYCCEVCDATDPHWMVTRTGDVVTTWACDVHLAAGCERLQRDFEVTELTVQHSPKAREWAAIGKSLNQIAGHDHA